METLVVTSRVGGTMEAKEALVTNKEVDSTTEVDSTKATGSLGIGAQVVLVAKGARVVLEDREAQGDHLETSREAGVNKWMANLL